MNKHIPQWIFLVIVCYYTKYRKTHLYHLSESQSDNSNQVVKQTKENLDLESCTDAISIKHVETDFDNREGQKFVY